MNLPTISQGARVTRKTNRKSDIQFWGAKSEGIQPGDSKIGIFVGLQDDEKGPSIIIKDLQNDQITKIFGCRSLLNEMHADNWPKDTKYYIYQQPLYSPGDIIIITYVSSFVANKGLAEGNLIAKFKVDEYQCGYQITEKDEYDIQCYLDQVAATAPLPVYQQPAPTLRNITPPVRPVQQSQPRLTQQTYAAPALTSPPNRVSSNLFAAKKTPSEFEV